MTETMNAVIYTEYGSADVLKMAKMKRPTPKAKEVLIKVHAATVSAGDVNMRGFTFVPQKMRMLVRLAFGFFKPRKPILGTVVAGEIVAIGKKVTRFKVGDSVFGMASLRLGAYAEYVCRPAEGGLALKPEGLSYEEIAALPFGTGTALYFLKERGNLQPGQKVLVNGASGGVGNYAVQIAKSMGAEVTGVCSTRNLDMVRGLGADHVIDYTREDFTQNGETYDLIVDTVFGKADFHRCKNSLTPEGRYCAVAGDFRETWQSFWNKQILTGTPSENKKNMEAIGELAKQGVVRPLIDRTYPLEQTSQAHEYVDTGRKRGSVIISVGEVDSGL